MTSDPPGTPPPDPSGAGGSGGPPRPPRGRDKRRPPPARPPGDDSVYDLGTTEDAVYDLGSTAGEESDEEERLRAIQEIVELTRSQEQADSEAAPDHSIELPIDKEADDIEKQRALEEVLKLGAEREAAKQKAAPVPVRRIDLPASEVASDLVKAQVLKEVVESAVRFTRAVAMAKQMRSYRARPIVLAVLAIPCLVLALYTVIARPEWVFGPNPATIAADQREAHLRFAMFLVAQRLHGYREANNGQLPRSLADVGEEWPEIEYRNLDGSVFELHGKALSTRPLVYRSYEDAAAFVHGSRQYLRASLP